MSTPALTPEEQQKAAQAQNAIALATEDVRREGLAVSVLHQRAETLTAEKTYIDTTNADLRRAAESIPDNRAARARNASLRAERDALRGGA